MEIQNFEQKNDPSLRMYENIRVPTPLPWDQTPNWGTNHKHTNRKKHETFILRKTFYYIISDPV